MAKSTGTESTKNPAAVALGRLGGLKGGKARAELHLYSGMRHGLQQVADDVASRIHDFVDSLREEASGRPA